MRLFLVNRRLTLSITAFVLLPIVIDQGSAQEKGDDWPMFQANPQRTGSVRTKGLEASPLPKWKFKVQGSVSSPAVVNGVVYFTTSKDDARGTAYALDTETGQKKWATAAPKGIWSSPAVAHGLVYFGCVDGYLHAFDAVTGQERWKFKFGSAVNSSPAVDANFVYIGCDDGNAYALDAKTGKGMWYARGEGAHKASSPALAEGEAFFSQHSGYVNAVNAKNGQQLWSFEAGGQIEVTPVVFEGMVCCVTKDGYVYGLTKKEGKEKWRYKTLGGIDSPPSVTDNKVYVGSNNGLMYALGAGDGDEKWRFQAESGIKTAPIIANGFVYFGTEQGYLYAIDIKNGQEKWKVKIGNHIDSSPAVVNGRIYIGCDGHLQVFEEGIGIMVGDGADPVWSPDGKKIAFRSYGGMDMDGGDIFYLGIMNSDGSERTVFKDIYMADFRPLFSPTGEKLLFPDLSRSGMRWMDLDGGRKQYLDQGTFKTTLSPSSQKKVSVESLPYDEMPGYKFFLVKVDHKEIAKVPCSEVYFNFDPYLNWSPDEEWVCLRTWEKKGPQNVWIVSTVDTVKRKIGHYSPATWSPDSTKMAFERDGHLWIAQSDGSQPRKVTKGKGYRPHPPYLSPSWSPTGERIAFLWEGGIALIDSNGKGFKMVPGTEGAGCRPSWSPDGKRIVFHIHSRHTMQYVVKIVDVD